MKSKKCKKPITAENIKGIYRMINEIAPT